MIILEKIIYQNFLSTGNSPNEIELNTHKSTLIIGKNGEGKSTILDAISFALYGKPFRKIKKAQLINSINNKKTLTTLFFRIGSRRYKIIRGIKPDVFEIYQDDILLPPTGATEYQSMLEDSILHMNFKTFSQVVLLSTTNFKPFMQLEAKERREIIDDILDIAIITNMNSVLKGRMTTLKENINSIESSLSLSRQKVELQKQYIETLKTDKNARENELLNSISGAETLISDYNKSLDIQNELLNNLVLTLPDDEMGLVGKKSKQSSMRSQLKSKITELNSTLEFYRDSIVCPTCNQEIDESIKEQQVSKANSKIAEINGAIEKLSDSLTTINSQLEEIKSIQYEITKVQKEIQSINSNIIAEQNFIKKLNKELNSLDNNEDGVLEDEQAKLKSLVEAAMCIVKQKSEYSEQKQYYDIIATLLKDSGVKTKIIDQYLPVINKLINRYLHEMGSWILFELDSEFNESIKSRHRDTFSYNSFSEGEKQRIDLAILFTWRTVAKMKNSVSINLFFADESLDKSLDLEGVDNVIKLLDTLGESTNAFVISHKHELVEKFDRVLEFKKVSNFSIVETISDRKE